MSLAVVIIVRDRTAHLVNVLRGLDRQSHQPDEVVVVVMGGEDPEGRVPAIDAPVFYVRMTPRPGTLPLAQARNLGARATDADLLVFLDVDCIPGCQLIDRYSRALHMDDALLMGEVRYLASGSVDDDWDEATLHAGSRSHPNRAAPEADGPVVTDRYELFWSLSFGVRKETFLITIGAFDPALDGYGGEDTDLAFAARARRVPLAWLPSAVAYHQHHETFAPPLQHLVSIVANATTFRRKWGAWPMEGWLWAFDDLGLVRFEPDRDRIELLRLPTDAELRAARRDQVVNFV